MNDLTKLRELLAKEKYPHTFVYKFIGKNTEAFAAGVAILATNNPELKETARRHSPNGAHCAITFALVATSPDAILHVYPQISAIPDLLVMI